MQTRENHFLESLKAALASYPQLEVSQSTRNSLNKHFQLVQNWNGVHNLTSVEGVGNFVGEHYLDCLIALSTWSNRDSISPVYDLGAGNGFPGIIAAVLFPEKRFVLVETSRKKCSFLRFSAAELKLQNLEVLQTRVESVKGIKQAITRAAFSKNKLNGIASAFSEGASLSLMTAPSFDAVDFTTNNPYWTLSNQSQYVLLSGALRTVVTLRRSNCFT